MNIDEKELKRQIKLSRYFDRCILYGEERGLLVAAYKKLYEAYEKAGYECTVFNSKETDFEELMESAMMISMFSSKRAFFVDNFDSSCVDASVWETFLSFMEGNDGEASIIIIASNVFDPKGKAKDKKLLTNIGHQGACVLFAKLQGKDLRDEIMNTGKKLNCYIPGNIAGYMIDTCGDDIALLRNECFKLSNYVEEGKEVTKRDVDLVCSKKEDANIYSLANLMLSGNVKEVMSEINTLISQKTAVIQILTNLTIAFAGLYNAKVAKENGKSYETAAKDLKEKFSWRMKNYYRDAQRADKRSLFDAMCVFMEAEYRFKSSACEERALLEKSCIEAMGKLKGNKI